MYKGNNLRIDSNFFIFCMIPGVIRIIIVPEDKASTNGGIEIAKEKHTFKICGTIRDKVSGKRIPNLIVQGFDKDIFYNNYLGKVTNDEKWMFCNIYFFLKKGVII